MDGFYPEDLLAELDNLQNVGHLENCDARGSDTNASCGDEAQFELRFEQGAQPLISEVAWTGQGCAISQVSCSLVSELIKGRTLAEAQHLTQQDLEELLGLEHLSLGRIKCLMLPISALRQVKNIKKDK